MCSEARSPGDSGSKEKTAEGCADNQGKPWGQTQAQQPGNQAATSSESTLEVWSSDSDSDCLPDLEDFLPDLDTQPPRVMTQIGFNPFHSSSPSSRKPSSVSVRKHKRERHFTDSFSSTSKHPKTEGGGDSQSSSAASSPHREQVADCAKSSTQTEERRTEQVADCAKSSTQTEERRTEQMKRRRDRISQEMQAGSSPVEQKEYSVFAFPVESSSKPAFGRRISVATETDKRRTKNRFSGVKFLQDVTTIPAAVDRLCTDFARLQSSCLDDLSDDLTDNNSFFNFIDVLEDFTYRRKPPSSLIQKVVNNGFFAQVEEKVCTCSYVVVLKLWQMYPDLISIDVPSVLVAGDVMKKHLLSTNSSLGRGSRTSSAARSRDTSEGGLPSFHQAKLFFQLYIKGLQLNLSECKLADQKSVSKSLTFTCLSSDGSQTLVRQVMHWLDFCLVVRQPQHMGEAKMWICQLQALLSVTVLVSRDRQEAAKKLASELKRTYKYLTDGSVKKELIQSVSSPLLLFYFLRLVMEDQCESTIVSSQFPSSFREVIHNYYMALPPQDHMTPPPSPSDDENAAAPMYSPQSCEELAMLIYFISKSFIACRQRRLSGDLRPQILKGSNLPALTPEERREFSISVQEFGAHLRTLSAEQTPATLTYINLLDCLCSCN
ncbi:hypothetical protein V1264_013671 [Littorina saxatilis]|uniref:Uncharacterized protein n=2 Tax=Littorina saxatilis TaxID=31220 RepID=A0AAN9BR47_9CAEN